MAEMETGAVHAFHEIKSMAFASGIFSAGAEGFFRDLKSGRQLFALVFAGFKPL